MAYSTIDKSTDFFNTVLYTGNGTAIGSSGNAITGVGHQPDLVWIKSRTTGEEHVITDSIRGTTKTIKPNSTAAEYTSAEGLNTFGSDGFTVGNSDQFNTNSENYVSWNWKAGTTSGINTTGADITPSAYSMNATSGISIIKYTGNGTDGAKIAHGLGAVPEMMIIKRLDNSNYWAVYHKSDNTDYLVFNASDAMSDAPIWKDTAPTSVYYQTDNSGSVNASGDNLVAYCFKSVTGYSKIGSYIGNGNADGTFVYTGFKPAYILIKKTSATDHWVVMDNKRQGYNFDNELLLPSDTRVEEDGASYGVDILSNGFKCRTTDGWTNASGQSYIYMAFGQSLVGSNNIPCTAR